jgi:hypothetical protein
MRSSRRAAVTALVAAAVLGGCSGLPGFGGGEPRRDPTVWIVLLDRSQSTQADSSMYESAVRQVVGKVQPGDRFVMAAVTATSGTDFRLSVDFDVPPPMPEQGLMQDPREYREQKSARDQAIEDATERIRVDSEAFLSARPSAARTALFESLLVIAPLVVAEKRRRVLVVLSDMIEDAGAIDFDRRPPTDDFTQKEIDRQNQAHTLPNLKGATVCVAGAVASPPQKAVAVERFWRAYFQATGATVHEGAYARTLTGCGPLSSPES